MNTIVDTVKSNLIELYDKYKDKGITSIYLWGSITTEDFNLSTSDIDTVAIVDDCFELNLETKIQNELQKNFKGENKFGFRVLYISELKDCNQRKSNLASYIFPAFFIFDLPNWVHIIGKEYSQKDFTDKIPTISNVMKFRTEEIINRKWKDASKIEIGREQYYIKCLWRIVHLLQLSRGKNGSFSYTFVLNNMNEEEKDIVSALDEIKQSGYDREIYLRHVPLLNRFTNTIMSK